MNTLERPPLDPQVAAFYGSRLEGAASHPSSVAQARADADAVFNDSGSKRIHVFETQDRTIPSCHQILREYFSIPDDEHEIPVRIYFPHAGKRAAGNTVACVSEPTVTHAAEPTVANAAESAVRNATAGAATSAAAHTGADTASGTDADTGEPDYGPDYGPDCGSDCGSDCGLPVMLYFHGGGFIMHNIASHDSLCRKLALSCDCIVISVGYRLAPEHKHPACMSDGLSAVMWAFQNAQAFGGDPFRLILAGDSAGASISAVVSLMLRDLSRTNRFKALIPKIGLQVLCYGPAGCIADDDSNSVRLFGHGGYVLPRAMLDWCMEQYVPESASPSDPYLNPGRAADLSELPRTLSITAECDPLRDDGEAFARRLSESGCTVTQYRAPGLMHGFLLYWEKFDGAQWVISIIANEVQNAF